jgi:hypothetical protein
MKLTLRSRLTEARSLVSAAKIACVVNSSIIVLIAPPCTDRNGLHRVSGTVSLYTSRVVDPIVSEVARVTALRISWE